MIGRQPERRGALLVCVVVCLSIAAGVAMAGVRSALDAHRQTRVERHLAQAEWLLEAGARRAAAQIRSTEDYEGETWSLDRDVLPGCGPATVQLVVNRTDDSSAAWVEVTVTLPSDSPQPVRRRHEFALPVP